ncbi:S9 family peptidase [SAR92 clade bacterium H231]|nr:S9 family peptidase [SAR92 clade bacterium H231]
MTKRANTTTQPTIEEMEARYQRAATLIQGASSKNLVQNDTVFPQWIDNTPCFWYEHNDKLANGAIGQQYRVVDASTGRNEAAFDQAALADVLSTAAGQAVQAEALPIDNVDITLSPLTVRFTAFGKHWQFDGDNNTCKAQDLLSDDWVVSPDGKQVAFTRDYNLWVRDLASDEEHALTEDGEEFFVYAAMGAAWGGTMGDGVQAIWSPDSKQLFTVQRDTRQVKNFPLLEHVPEDGSLRPKIIENRMALPGDEHVEEYRLLAIDVSTGQIQDAHYRRIPSVRNAWGFFNAQIGWWSNDSRRAYFIDQTRGDKVLRLVEFDTHTGATRILFEETSETHINLSADSESYPSHMPLPDSNELIWWSERSGWAHIYLYDLDTGELKNTITQGDWLVRDVCRFDAKRREVFIQTAGRVEGRDPYYRDICRVHVDTGELTTVLSTDDEYVVHTQKSLLFQNAEGAIGWDIGKQTAGVSPCGDYIVTTRSRVDQVPVSLLLDREGAVVCELETADISALPTGWQWPEPVKLLAADGKTDIYGVVYRPSNFSADKQYPVINSMWNGPDVPSVTKGSFINSQSHGGLSNLASAALAELGFIVVIIDSRGTSFRNKAFVDESCGWLPNSAHTGDHVGGIRQLAERYPYMDLNNVGVIAPYGPTGALHNLLECPDFYKVGAVYCPQDSRLMGAAVWSEKYEGLSGPDKKHRYPEDLVDNLQGKLLLMHGLLDVCNTPAATFRLVKALYKANKDFDMLVIPDVGHDLPGYVIRRSWDYLVRHLLKAEPPKEFNLVTKQFLVGSEFEH